MITNFQLKPRQCKYHNLWQQFICMNKQCQYRALLCSQCTRQNHGNHLHDIRSIQSFIESFKQKVKFYETQFDKDKIIINVKEIIRAKMNELDQTMNELFINIVKILEKEKQSIKEKLKSLQEKYQNMENQYKKNLQQRFDCLEYLSAYKNSPKVLQARLLCSSQWGVVSIKNSLIDIKNLSTNQGRDVNYLTDTIVQESQKILKEDNFLYSLKRFIHDVGPTQESLLNRNARITSFIQKSIVTTNTIPTTPKSSRVIIERPRTYSLSSMTPPLKGVSLSPNITLHNIQTTRQPSLQRIPSKIPSQSNISNPNNLNNLNKNTYIKGLRKLKLSQVIIK